MLATWSRSSGGGVTGLLTTVSSGSVQRLSGRAGKGRVGPAVWMLAFQSCDFPAHFSFRA